MDLSMPGVGIHCYHVLGKSGGPGGNGALLIHGQGPAVKQQGILPPHLVHIDQRQLVVSADPCKDFLFNRFFAYLEWRGRDIDQQVNIFTR